MVLKCPFCKENAAPGRKDCPKCRMVMARECPHCREEISVLAELCKYCGETVEPKAGTRVRASTVRPAAAAEAAKQTPEIVYVDEVRSCAWENRSQKFLARWWGTFREANFHPRTFFRTMPTEGGKSRPIAFVFSLYLQLLLFLELLAIPVLSVLMMAGEIAVPYSAPKVMALVVLGNMAAIPLLYFAVATVLFVASALTHLVVKVLGAKGSFESTMRIVGYAHSAEAWHMIPGLGTPVATVMKPVLRYHGFRQVLELSKGRALLATLLPYLIVGLVALAAVLADGCRFCC